MRKKDPKIIRVGDTVRIINPEFFIRCGYPMSFKDACRIVEKEHKDRIAEFIRGFDFTTYTNKGSGLLGFPISEEKWEDNRTFSKIVGALAYEYVRAKRFGGTERKIYTKHCPDYKDKRMTVEYIKFFQTGNYVRGSGESYDSYAGEYDYDPSFLEDQKTHKILGLCPLDAVFFFHPDKNVDDYIIESIHVEKVFENVNQN